MISDLLSTTAFATLSFAGINGSELSQSAQKDMIVQALRTAFPKPSAFIEEVSRMELALEVTLRHKRLRVRCLRCESGHDTQLLAPESVRFATTGRGLRQFELTFETLTVADGETKEHERHAWKARVEESDLKFGVFTTAPMTPGQTFQLGNSKVLACLGLVRCQPGQSFLTHAEAEDSRKRMGQLIVKQKLRTMSAITPQALASPTYVTRGDTVTLRLSTPTGLHLQTQAKALKKGTLGEMIPVEVARGNRKRQVVRARVVARGEVEHAN